MLRKIKNYLSCLLLLTVICACSKTIPKEALELKNDSFAMRQLQTRVFDSNNEKTIIIACANVLQDLGYNVDESEVQLGVITSSKNRDAYSRGKALSTMLIGGLLGVNTYRMIEHSQKIRLTVISKPLGNKTSVRITIQRVLYNVEGSVIEAKSVEDPKIYSEFFTKLSHSIFLNAHEI
jgi:hypothetical protein